jgi:hypothetical protein
MDGYGMKHFLDIPDLHPNGFKTNGLGKIRLYKGGDVVQWASDQLDETPIVSNPGESLAQLDDSVNENIPGGWTLPVVVAAAIATDGLSLGATEGAAAVGEGTAAAGEGTAAVGEGTAAVGEGTAAADSGVVVTPVPEPPVATPFETTPTFDFSPDVPVSDVAPELDPTSNLIDQAATAQTPDQVALDKLVEQQSSLYPAIGNNIIGLPQIGDAALAGAGKGALTTVAVNALTGRPVTLSDVLKGAVIGGVSGGAGSLVGQAAGSSLLGNLAGTAAGVGTTLALTPGSSAAKAVIPAAAGALTLAGTNTGANTDANTSLSSTGTNDGLTTGSPLSSSTQNKIPTPISGQSITGAPVYNTNTQLLQQLKQLDPKLLSMIAPHLSSSSQNADLMQSGLSSLNPPTQATGGQQQNNPYSSLMQTMLAEKGGSNPSNSLLSSGVNMLSGSSPLGYKDGGDVHKPEFITGATGHYVKGRGDGQSDDIPAMLADGEYVFDADTVAALGNGSSDAGAKLLDHFRESLREHKRSAPTDKIPPKASPLAYMKEALRRHTKG